MGAHRTHAALDVVVLGMLVQGSRGALAVNHAAAHGNRAVHDRLKQGWVAGQPHGVDAALRDGQVYGFCEVERYDARVAQIWRHWDLSAAGWLVAMRRRASCWSRHATAGDAACRV